MSIPFATDLSDLSGDLGELKSATVSVRTTTVLGDIDVAGGTGDRGVATTVTDTGVEANVQERPAEERIAETAAARTAYGVLVRGEDLANHGSTEPTPGRTEVRIGSVWMPAVSVEPVAGGAWWSIEVEGDG